MRGLINSVGLVKRNEVSKDKIEAPREGTCFPLQSVTLLYTLPLSLTLSRNTSFFFLPYNYTLFFVVSYIYSSNPYILRILFTI